MRMEKVEKDIALFITWFEGYQTFARKLSENEIQELLDNGIDIFLNLQSFIHSK